MKKILFIFIIGIFCFVVAKSSSFAFNDSIKNTTDQNLARPYVVEVADAGGNISNEYKGISKNTDPYLISKDLGAGPFAEDRYKSFPDIRMNIGSKITLYRAPAIKIKDGKRSKEVRSWQKTVGELFTEQKIEIGKDDKVNFANDTVVENSMEISITRVAITTVVEKETIKYTTVKKSNPNVEKGNKKTLQAGKNGTKDKYYLVRREDGDEVSRAFIKNEIVAESVPEIIEVGTKVVVYGSGKATYYKWPSMESKNKYYAASKTIPKGTDVWVVNIANGKGVKVTILDWVGANVAIDLSKTAFDQIANKSGVINNVRIEKYYPE